MVVGWIKPTPEMAATDNQQLLLPFAEHVKPSCVRLLDISHTLAARILADPLNSSN